MAGRGDAGGVVDVLQADRHPVQGAAPIAGGDFRLGHFGGCHAFVLQHEDVAVQLMIERRNPLEGGCGEIDWGELAGADESGGLRNGQQGGGGRELRIHGSGSLAEAEHRGWFMTVRAVAFEFAGGCRQVGDDVGQAG